MKLVSTLVFVLALSACAAAAEPPPAEDKDLTILQLRRALAAEKIERLRLEYVITKAELDRMEAELKKKTAKPEGKDEN